MQWHIGLARCVFFPEILEVVNLVDAHQKRSVGKFSLDLLCGVLLREPGAILAQRRFRHKCAKGAYQFTFWVIVLLHQSAAYDSLHDWRFSRLAVDRIMSVDQPKR